MDDNSLGIYVVKEKTFYYLESGKVYIRNTVDRLKRVLSQRQLIEFSQHDYLNTNDYKVMSCRDAKIDDLEMKAIYVSKHVQESMEKQKAEESEKKSSWG